MKVEIIVECPVCNSPLERIKDQLYCRSTTCPAQSSKKLEHYAHVLKIKGLGEKTIEKLNLENIEDIYSLLLKEDFVFSVIGEKLGEKLLEEIKKATTVDIGTFLAGMSIPLLGLTTAKKLVGRVNSIEDITKELCLQSGIGEKASSNLMEWINNNYVPLPISFKEVNNNSNKVKTICISGKVQGYTKSKLKSILEDMGFEVKDNVTKNLDILISDESNTTKVNKAKEYNIQIISFDNFLKEFKNNE